MPVRSLSDDLLERLVARLGTPLYVYHTDIIGRRLADLRGFDVIRCPPFQCAAGCRYPIGLRSNHSTLRIRSGQAPLRLARWATPRGTGPSM